MNRPRKSDDGLFPPLDYQALAVFPQLFAPAADKTALNGLGVV